MSSATPRTTTPSPWRRRALLGVAILAGHVLLAIGALALVLHHLDDGLVKSRLRAIARSTTGFEIDYTSASGALLSGLRIEGLTIATPAPFRSFAPFLVRVGALEVAWGPSRLLRSAPRVDRVALRDLAIVLVVDRDGRSSLDVAAPANAPAPVKASRPLSSQLADLFGQSLPVGELELDPIHATIIRTDGRTRVETITLEGLRARLEAEKTSQGRDLALDLGTAAAPLPLVLRRDGATRGEAKMSLYLHAATTRDGTTVGVELRLVAQDLVPKLKLDRVLSVDAAVHTFPSEHRVVASLKRFEVGDAALALSAELDHADDLKQAPVVRTLTGHLDAAKLFSLVPADLARALPTVGGGGVDLRAERVALGSPPRVLDGGSASMVGKLTHLRASIPALELAAHALSVDLHAETDGSLRGELGLDVESLRHAAAGLRFETHMTKLVASLHGVRLAPTGSSGSVELRIDVGSATAGLGALSLDASALSLRAHGALRAQPPYAGRLELRAERLRATNGGQLLADDALSAELKLESLFPDRDQPTASPAEAHLEIALGASKISLEAKKAAAALDYALTATLPSLTPLARVLGSPTGVPWAKMSLALRSSGRVDPLTGAPHVREETSIDIQHPELHGKGGALAATSLSATLRSDGTSRHHEGNLALAWQALRRDGALLGDGRITTSVLFDAGGPTLHMKLGSSGAAAPELNADVQLGFQRAHRRVTFEVAADAHKLDPIAPMVNAARILHGFDLGALGLTLKTHGSLGGVVDSIGADGTPKMNADPLNKLDGELAFDVRATQLGWHDGARSVETPEISWKGTLHAEHARKVLAASVELDELHLAFGPRRLDLSGVSDALEVTLAGDPELGQLDVTDRLSLRTLKQDVLRAYPTGGLSFVLTASRDHDAVIRMPELRIENAAAGTSVLLRGGLDLGEGRRALSLRGNLTQDLAKLWSARQDFIGRGTLATEVSVDSGDLRLYRATAALRLKGGHIELPRQKIKLDAVDGEIPAAADVLYGPGGVRLLRNVEVNNYSELRFVDQHPLLSRRSYLSIGSVETPWATVAPLAGNLLVDNNVLSMSQLELGVRGGHVSGRALVALQGLDSQVQLNVRASDLRSSRGEPFDGNMAVGISVRQHSVQGRAEILRIGRRHLLDLLDVVDPARVDAGMNRVRHALSLGYPDHVRMSFSRGFASAKITFGGIARLLKIDEIRGIPMGPIIDRVLDPFLEEEEE